ncbi:AsmA-like C-terminal region-containing protein [Sediminicoccus sp. KRV36]|uniref:AsmA family protein n=1 Tax=Sediminicoccus sp. KRV36 TaxID=3133721 RepID=UPI00200DA4C3|nr:AsmA-like C-terminal region-containing protein [Sediminicoccus rosea]UPY39260.1 hypothetical protein LHU95_11365 [Sediminicoccus rosea]
MSDTETPAEAKPPAKAPMPVWWRVLFGVAGLLLLLLSLPVGAWFLLPRLELAHLAADRASTMLGRPVTIESLRITPGERLGVVLRGVKLANIEGGTRDDMLRLDALSAELDLMALLHGTPVLREARVEGLSVLLERNAAREANWHFGPAREAGPAGSPAHRRQIPLFDAIRIAGSEVIFRTTGGLILPTRLETASLTAGDENAPILLQATGTYNGVPITLEGPLGSIAALREAGSPFGLDLSAMAGETSLTLIGSSTDPLNFDAVQGRLELRAPSPATLLALGGAGMEGVPDIAIELAGTLDRQGDVWRMTTLEGQADGAPFTGSLLRFTEGPRGEPDALAMDLAFTKLDLNRLLRAGGHGQEGEADLPLAVFTAPDPLIELRMSANELLYDALHAREARLVASLVPGEVRVETLSMQAFGARISATGRLEADEDDLQVAADVTMTEGDLEALRRAFGIRELPISGRIEGRLAVTGRGRSLNAAARGAHVSAVLAMSGGSIAREVIEMTTTDLRALFRTARGRVRLSCMIAVLDMRAGVGEVAPMRLRSANGMISGMASFDLNRQRLDLIIGSHRQTTGSFALDIPIRVSGSFADPDILPAQWSTAGRARLSAGDQTVPLPPALRDYARRSPCFFAGGR